MRCKQTLLIAVCLLFHNASAFMSPLVSRQVCRYKKEQHHSYLKNDHVSRSKRQVQEGQTHLSLSGQDIIEAGVSFDTFAPQFLWILIIAAPESSLTKKIMGSILPIVGLAMIHFIIVATAASQEGALSQILIFGEVFDPSLSQLSGMQKLFAIPNFVAEEWPHVLIWDLFVGRAIWIDGLERGINTRLALAFCNFIGPPGLLIHVATCLLTEKGLPSMGYNPTDESEEI